MLGHFINSSMISLGQIQEKYEQKHGQNYIHSHIG